MALQILLQKPYVAVSQQKQSSVETSKVLSYNENILNIQ